MYATYTAQQHDGTTHHERRTNNGIIGRSDGVHRQSSALASAFVNISTNGVGVSVCVGVGVDCGVGVGVGV